MIDYKLDTVFSLAADFLQVANVCFSCKHMSASIFTSQIIFMFCSVYVQGKRHGEI